MDNCLCRWACLLGLAIAAPVSGQVSGWRGDGTGRWLDAHPPVAWDLASGKNILWQTRVGKGQASPVIAGERIFVMAEPDRLLCLDIRDGKVLWERAHGLAALKLEIKPSQELPTPASGCGFSAATPVTDGKSVYVCFGSGIVAAYDLDGSRRWLRFLDLPQPTQYGRSASPLLSGDKLLITFANLLALDVQTGKTLWQADKAEPAYGTPALARIGGADVALTPSGACVRISDGKILASHLGEMPYASPIVQGGVVYYAGSTTQAIKLPEQAADSFKPVILWTCDDVEGEIFASPLWHDDKLYCASNQGMLYVLDAKTGKMIYTKELPIRSASVNAVEPANIYPSLALAGQHILLSNDAGETLVLESATEYKQAALNLLGKGSGASPLPHGQMLLLRSGQNLYCIDTVARAARP